MKIVRSIICLTFLIFTLDAYADEDLIPLYHNVSFYTGTNTWFVSRSQIEKSAGWNETGEPSLQVGKAISLAKAWVVSKGGNTNSYVMTVEFRPIDRGHPPESPSKFRHFWYYIIRFHEVAQFGSSLTCIVLLDGSIVEPQSTAQKKSIFDYLD